MTVAEISAFVAAIYLGGLVFQYPIGWVSDRMDRRVLIMGLTAAGALVTLGGALFSGEYAVVLVLGFVIGGVANPLYSLIIAYTNDFLAPSDMAAASGGLLFINGLGAMTGPLVIGAAMTRFGANAFFAYIGDPLRADRALCALPLDEAGGAAGETSSYAPVLPQASPVALEVAQEVAIERAGGGDRRAAAEAAFHLLRLCERVRLRTGDAMDTTGQHRGTGNCSTSGSARSGRTGWYAPTRRVDRTIRDRWGALWERGAGRRARPSGARTLDAGAWRS